eukprot:3398256-Ditylum_brightwellii.AAC.1
MDKTYKYKAFKTLGKGGRKPKDHVMIQVCLVYNVKQDGRHKGRFVAGGHMTELNMDTYYSSKEFQYYGHEGHLMLIVKELY